MKNIFSTIILLFVFSISKGQNFYQQFKEQLNRGDTTKQKQVLQKWSKTGANEAEFYTASFNYFYSKGINSFVSFDAEPKNDNSFVVTDSIGIKRYLNEIIVPNEQTMNLAFEVIDKGINKFPRRIDMRFGKIYALGTLKEYNRFTEEIIEAIKFSKQINNRWLDELNEPFVNSEKSFLATIYAYMTQLYNTMDDDLLPNIEKIALNVVDKYPNHIESLSMLGVVYTIQNNYDDGIKYLLRANKINQEDHIVLGNIAQLYKRKGDTKNAKKYFKLMLKHGDEQGKMIAKKELEALE